MYRYLQRFLSVLMITSAMVDYANAEPAPAPEKKGTMMLDLKRLLPQPEPKPIEPPKPTPLPEPEIKPVEIVPETPLERFKRNEKKAEAGITQAQYELGLSYAQDFERVVPLNFFVAISWLQKAAEKNHRMAQLQLGRFCETGRGMEAKNLPDAIKWRRSSALLGSKLSQRWMTQLYLNAFHGSKAFEGIIEQDDSNLVEAYAWACLTAEQSHAQRDSLNTPTAKEIAAGHALTERDYGFEKSAANAGEQDRDGIAKNPRFTKKLFDEALLRAAALNLEAKEYQKANKPR